MGGGGATYTMVEADGTRTPGLTYADARQFVGQRGIRMETATGREYRPRPRRAAATGRRRTAFEAQRAYAR